MSAPVSPLSPSSLYAATPVDERHTPLTNNAPTSNTSRVDSAESWWGKFRSLNGSPKELWIAFIIKFFDSLATFTLSLILTLFLTEEFGYSDVKSGTIYGAYGAMNTVYGLFTGLLVDRIGVSKSVRLGVFLTLVSRCLLFAITATPAGHTTLLFVLLGLLPAAQSLVLPVLMIGVRRYTVGKNRGYAYGIFYAIMNVGALMAGPLVDAFRKFIPGDDMLPDGLVPAETVDTFKWTPFRATLFVGVLSGAIELLLCLFLTEIKVEEDGAESKIAQSEAPSNETGVLSPEDATAQQSDSPSASSSYLRKTQVFVPSDTPALVSLRETLRSPSFWRFATVGFIVTNLRMIFRHLDATLPKYMIRMFGSSAPFGSIYAINPAVVIVLTPILGALTSTFDTLRMIRFGMFVSAASLIFIIVFDDKIWGCAIFLFIFSIGEALWSPRYYVLSVTAAKEGKEGVFAAFAFAPLFLAQLPVGALSGYLLQTFCPSEDKCDGTALWGVIGSLSALSPILMVVLWPVLYVPNVEEDNEIGQGQNPICENAIDESQLSEPLLQVPS